MQNTFREAMDGRDALCKLLYANLFGWLVETINKTTATSMPESDMGSIYVLDIFGFENFKTNSFEQLLINFANEKLQQQFVGYVFKAEKKEYIKEDIDGSHILFRDNQPVLTALEGTGGILRHLDDQCSLGARGSDETYLAKIQEIARRAPKVGANDEDEGLSVVRVPKVKGTPCFTVQHYAGPVEYTVVGMRDKNVASRATDVLELLLCEAGSEADNTTHQILRATERAAASSSVVKGRKKKTLAAEFKSQLTDLLAHIDRSEVHYVRCIKPNETADPKNFNDEVVLHQLRYQGIVEAVKVARSAFPCRIKHVHVLKRFWLCSRDKVLFGEQSDRKAATEAGAGAEVEAEAQAATSDKDAAEKLVTMLFSSDEARRTMCERPLSEIFAVGKTKMFLQMEALELLEASQTRVQHSVCTVMQKHARGRIAARRFRAARQATYLIQRVARGAAARHVARMLRSIALLQAIMLTELHKKDFTAQRQAALQIQRYGRAYTVRTNFLRTRSAALSVQSQTRAHLAGQRDRQEFLRTRNAAVLIQLRTRDHLEAKAAAAAAAAAAAEAAKVAAEKAAAEAKAAAEKAAAEAKAAAEKAAAEAKAAAEKAAAEAKAAAEKAAAEAKAADEKAAAEEEAAVKRAAAEAKTAAAVQAAADAAAAEQATAKAAAVLAEAKAASAAAVAAQAEAEAAAEAAAAADDSDDDDDDDDDEPSEPVLGANCKVVAKYDYAPEESTDLSFSEGTVLTDVEKQPGDGWWTGTLNGKQGFFPAAYTEAYVEPPEVC